MIRFGEIEVGQEFTAYGETLTKQNSMMALSSSGQQFFMNNKDLVKRILPSIPIEVVDDILPVPVKHTNHEKLLSNIRCMFITIPNRLVQFSFNNGEVVSEYRELNPDKRYDFPELKTTIRLECVISAFSFKPEWRLVRYDYGSNYGIYYSSKFLNDSDWLFVENKS